MSDDSGRLGLLGCSHLTAKMADVVERIVMCNEYQGLDRDQVLDRTFHHPARHRRQEAGAPG